MRTIHYDFRPWNDIFDHGIVEGKLSVSDCNKLKAEFNKFFKDCKCSAVYFTDNNDKMFFGMKIYPAVDSDKIYDYLTGNDNIKVGDYFVEIDSKLFNPLLGLKGEEITAVALHEIGHVVNDTQSIRNARDYIASYLADNKETLSYSNSIHYKEILAYGLKDFISKDRSFFYNPNYEELMADDFVRACGYEKYLDTAFKKIYKNNSKMYQGTDVDKFVVFAWTLQIYKALRFRRVGALKTLARAQAITGSKIERAEMDAVARSIRRIDDQTLIESVNDKVKARLRRVRVETLRSMESDYYDLNMRVRNVEDEDDALYIMRQINTRIGIIDDFLDNDEIDDHERKKLFDLQSKFSSLRETLSKSVTYKSRTYGIYVNYPDIRDCR